MLCLGFNVIILAFYLETGPTDVALAWEDAGSAAQQSTMAYVHSKNAVVLVSAGMVPSLPDFFRSSKKTLFLELTTFFSPLQKHKVVRLLLPLHCLPLPLVPRMVPR